MTFMIPLFHFPPLLTLSSVSTGFLSPEADPATLAQQLRAQDL